MLVAIFFSIFGQNAVGRPIIAARKIHFTVHGKQSDTKVSQVSKPHWRWAPF